MDGFFVTGTDTGVGKTVVSAALMHHLRARGPVRYWKPIATGFPDDDDTATVRRLGACSDAEIHKAGFRFRQPLSPHLASRLEGARIELPAVCALRPPRDAILIAEGAGGTRVPINDETFMTDLMLALDLRVVIVARSTLGTINHTLLTIEALRRRSIAVAGVVLVGPPNAENRDAIARYGEVPIVGELPWLEPLDASALRDWASSVILSREDGEGPSARHRQDPSPSSRLGMTRA